MEQHIIQCHIVSPILKANTLYHSYNVRIYIQGMYIYACNNLQLRYNDNHLQNV